MEAFGECGSRVIASPRAAPAGWVVDTGGGAPIREENRKRMRELGLIIGMRGSVERIAAGIAATMAKRPNQRVAPEDRARSALRERRAAYADTVVTFDGDLDATATV